MSTLEEKIKAIMESKIASEETLNEESIEKLEEKSKVSLESNEDNETNKDKDMEDKKVEEQLIAAATDVSAEEKNAKLKVGLNKKEAAGKLPTDVAADEQNDNDDNVKLKVGLDKKDVGGKLPEPIVKEHMDALFNGEELSEEFQAKAATIFEAAVNQVAQERAEQLAEEYAQQLVSLQEQFETQLNEAVVELHEEMVNNIDEFLNAVVEEWKEENRLAIESGIKVEMVNSFIDGLKTLFNEHYVNIPEDKLDIIEEQVNEIVTLSQAAQELSEENEALKHEINALKKTLIFEGVAEDLTDVQKEKFVKLIETVDFTDEEEYRSKLETLKESYFPATKLQPETKEEKDVIMNSYVQAVAQKLKF